MCVPEAGGGVGGSSSGSSFILSLACGGQRARGMESDDGGIADRQFRGMPARDSRLSIGPTES